MNLLRTSLWFGKLLVNTVDYSNSIFFYNLRLFSCHAGSHRFRCFFLYRACFFPNLHSQGYFHLFYYWILYVSAIVPCFGISSALSMFLHEPDILIKCDHSRLKNDEARHSSYGKIASHTISNFIIIIILAILFFSTSEVLINEITWSLVVAYIIFGKRHPMQFQVCINLNTQILNHSLFFRNTNGAEWVYKLVYGTASGL